ncbi:hypothetical protein [Nitrospirillum pindoramense]|uniref:Uncharacterized protein n=1 Tax=Nitrospirillum amazonense TaxID=28077 RepID=A0A560HFX4_9PROT|nr:hypothetical protein [Nitrospirillum amazonense]TWB45338.1 hypothetical protein FBZ90_102296 [Nitrospirillum amazonense]
MGKRLVPSFLIMIALATPAIGATAQDATSQAPATPDPASSAPAASEPAASNPTKEQAAPPSQTAAPADATATAAPESANNPPAQKPVKKHCPTTGSRLGGDCQAGVQADPRQVLENRTNPSGMLPPH